MPLLKAASAGRYCGELKAAGGVCRSGNQSPAEHAFQRDRAKRRCYGGAKRVTICSLGPTLLGDSKTHRPRGLCSSDRPKPAVNVSTWSRGSAILGCGTERYQRRDILPQCRAAAATGDGELQPNGEQGRAPPWRQLLDARPRMDETDRKILKLWGPAILNFILPSLLGAVDVFWVGRMNDAAALAGQGAANQIYDAVFFVVSFIPVLITPLVAKASASGDKDKLRQEVSEAVVVSSILGAIATVASILYASQALALVGVVPGSEIAMHAVPSIQCRAISLIPGLVAFAAFATYRGMMDVVTPLRVSAASQLINAILDPILIFGVPSVGIPAMGVAGAALATTISQCFSFVVYIFLLLKQDVLRLASLARLPRISALCELAVGGFAVQLRTISLNLVFLTMTKTVLEMDATGTAAAAHTITIQVWRVSLMALLAQSGIASAMVPQALNRPGGGKEAGKAVADRMLVWGLYAGLVLGALQLLALPMLKVFSTVPEVQQAALVPCMVGALVQGTNGMVYAGEGIMQGHQAFTRLAVHFVAGAAVLLLYLQTTSSLSGMWFGFWIYTNIRLVGALHHHFVSGPLAGRDSN